MLKSYFLLTTLFSLSLSAAPLKTSMFDLENEYQFLSYKQDYQTSYQQVKLLLNSDKLDPIFKEALNEVFYQYFPLKEPTIESKQALEYISFLNMQIKEFYSLLQFARLNEIEKFNQISQKLIENQPKLNQLAKPLKLSFLDTHWQTNKENSPLLPAQEPLSKTPSLEADYLKTHKIEPLNSKPLDLEENAFLVGTTIQAPEYGD